MTPITSQLIFKIKRFKSVKDRGWDDILDIYSKNTEITIRTSTNEIEYWVENYEKKFSDEFYILGLYCNEHAIGYCEVAYFKIEKLIFIDYIVINERDRGFNIFFPLASLIKEYIDENYRDARYIIGEIACFSEKIEENPPIETKKMMNLFQMIQFSEIKAHYYSPMLGIDNHESKMWAILMLYAPNNIPSKLTKSTYLELLKTIYYKHYGRWYAEFLSEDQKKKYIKHLDELYSEGSSYIESDYVFVNKDSSWPLIPSLRKSKQISSIITGIVVLLLAGGLGAIIYLIIAKRIDVDIIKYIYWIVYLILSLSLAYFSTKQNNFSQKIKKILSYFFIE